MPRNLLSELGIRLSEPVFQHRETLARAMSKARASRATGKVQGVRALARRICTRPCTCRYACRLRSIAQVTRYVLTTTSAGVTQPLPVRDTLIAGKGPSHTPNREPGPDAKNVTRQFETHDPPGSAPSRPVYAVIHEYDDGPGATEAVAHLSVP